MKIIIVGGTGLIGKKLVALLRAAGHEALAAAPSTGVNAVNGEGLAAALAGADVVVDVSNAPVWEDSAVLEFFTASTRNLLAAETAAGVGHHVALSVVGTARLQSSGYFRAKQAQEDLIRQSPVPYTIVQATQFFEFVENIAAFSTVGDGLRVPPALIQPIASEEVAAVVARVAAGEPRNGTVEIGGPVAYRLEELMRMYLDSRNDTRSMTVDPDFGYFGTPVGERALVPEADAERGSRRFEEWLRPAAV